MFRSKKRREGLRTSARLQPYRRRLKTGAVVGRQEVGSQAGDDDIPDPVVVSGHLVLVEDELIVWRLLSTCVYFTQVHVNEPLLSPQRDEAVRSKVTATESVASPQNRLALLADAAVSTLCDSGLHCIHLLFTGRCIVCSFLNVCRSLWTKGTYSLQGEPMQISGLSVISLRLPR